MLETEFHLIGFKDDDDFIKVDAFLHVFAQRVSTKRKDVDKVQRLKWSAL